MNCPKCGKEVQYDSISATFYCEDCSYLFGAEEVMKPKKRKKTKSSDHIGAVADIILNIATMIPVFGLFVIYVIMQSGASEEHKQVYATRIVSRILVYAILLLAFTLFVSEQRSGMALKMHKALELLSESVINANNHDKEIYVPELKANGLDYMKSVTEFEYTGIKYPIEFYKYLDSAQISGSQVLNLIHEYAEDIGILLKTQSMVEKYDNMTYLNIGCRVDGSEQLEDSSTYLYKGNLDKITELYMNGFNEVSNIDSSVVEVSKYIYYIHKDRLYNMQFIKNEDTTIAVAFMEVSNEK